MSPIQVTGDAIGVVKMYGEIFTTTTDSPFSIKFRTSDYIVNRLDALNRNKKVKAIIVRINSPGGAVAASQEIYNKIMEIREGGKPIVASMADIAASGGYYVASAADYIVANPGTLTGSIGVIIMNLNFQKLMEKWGIGATIFKSGEYKDILAFYRDMEEKEREILQNLVDTVHNQFIDAVANGRNLPDESVRDIADGRIVTGEEAVRLNLVDEIGDYHVAVQIAKEMAGIEGEVELLDRELYWDSLFQLLATSSIDRIFHVLGLETAGSLPVKYLYQPPF
jgi:protease-4